MMDNSQNVSKTKTEVNFSRRLFFKTTAVKVGTGLVAFIPALAFLQRATSLSQLNPEYVPCIKTGPCNREYIDCAPEGAQFDARDVHYFCNCCIPGVS